MNPREQRFDSMVHASLLVVVSISVAIIAVSGVRSVVAGMVLITSLGFHPGYARAV